MSDRTEQLEAQAPVGGGIVGLLECSPPSSACTPRANSPALGSD